MVNNTQNNNNITFDGLLAKKGGECIKILNELDFLISNASTVPFSSKVMVDAEEILQLIERFKEKFPNELEQSDMVIREVQGIVENAEQIADSIVVNAETRASQILNESKILREAQTRADYILAEAMQNKELIKQDVENYIFNLFNSAENGFRDAIVSIKQTKNSIKEM